MRCTVDFGGFLLETDIVLMSDDEQDYDYNYADIRLSSGNTDISSRIAVNEKAVSRFACDMERLFRENYSYDPVSDVRAELTDGMQYIAFEHDDTIDVLFTARLSHNGTETEFSEYIPTLSIEKMVDALDLYR